MNIAIVDSLVGQGIYTVPEASRLTGTPTRSIRRWLKGYKYRAATQVREIEAVWQGDIAEIRGHVALSFLDLLEVRMVQAFRSRGVTWPAIREAARVACDQYKTGHPFTVRRFRTDGNRIFSEIKETETIRLFDLNRKHYVFSQIVEPSLYEGIEFAGEQPARWYPRSRRRRIVVDPERSFGKPIINESGVPTEILASAAKVEETLEDVARWYDVKVGDVRAAVEFEASLVA